MAGIPKYAAGVPRHELVKILCRGGSCPKGQSTYARLALREGGPIPGDSGRYAGYVAHCLRCGYRATDTYNWQGP
jgi:hypothetical protein